MALATSNRPTLDAITNARRINKAVLVQTITNNGSLAPEWHASVSDVAHRIATHEEYAIGARVGVNEAHPLHGYLQQRDGSWALVENLPANKMRRPWLNATAYA